MDCLLPTLLISFFMLWKPLQATMATEEPGRALIHTQVGDVVALGSHGEQAWVKLANGTKMELFPVVDKLRYTFNARKHARFTTSNRVTKRRKVSSSSPFATCARCKCCDSTQSLCLQAPCCFNIVCDDPKQPFGVCSLAPFTCNCMTC